MKKLERISLSKDRKALTVGELKLVRGGTDPVTPLPVPLPPLPEDNGIGTSPSDPRNTFI